MADPNSPQSSAALVNVPLQHSLLIGSTIREILYGVELATFFAAVYCICHRSSYYRKRQRFYIAYGGILIVLATISVTADALWAKYTLINANAPNGQVGSHGSSDSGWYNHLGFSADATANILGDGLLVFRCYIIWSRRWYILTIPILLYLASSALAIIAVVASVLPDTSPFNGRFRAGLPWFSLSVSLNIIITSMICFRLLRMRAPMRELLSSSESSNIYTSIAAMLIESAAVFSILGIGLIVLAARNDPLSFAFSHIWTIFSSLSPQMIILRVSMGREWLKGSADETPTALVFAQPVTLHEGSRGVCKVSSISSTGNTEDPIYGPRTPSAAADGSGIPV